MWFINRCGANPSIRWSCYIGLRYACIIAKYSAISDHISVCQDCNGKGVTLEDFKILQRSHCKEETMVHEALAIKDKKPILNKNLVKPGKTFTLQIF